MKEIIQNVFLSSILGLLLTLGPWKNLSAQYLFQISSSGINQWNYVEGEEFNQPEISDDKWHTAFPWSRIGLPQSIYFSESNIIIDSGIVKFRVKKEKTIAHLAEWEMDTSAFVRFNNLPDSNRNIQLDYTGGLIWSKKKYKYGFFELRFKSTNSFGIWPAFWLFGENNNEIDIMELKGEKPKHIHVNVHCPDGCRNYVSGLFNRTKAFGHWVKTTGDLTEDYNVIAAEWQRDFIKFYLNGYLIAIYNGTIDVPLALTVGSGNAYKGGPFPPGVGPKTEYPSDFTVDYLRIWSADSAERKQNLQNQDFSSIPWEEKENSGPKKSKPKFHKKAKQYLEPILTLAVLPMKQRAFVLNLLGEDVLRSLLKIRMLSLSGRTLFEKNDDWKSSELVELGPITEKEIILEVTYGTHTLTNKLKVYVE